MSILEYLYLIPVICRLGGCYFVVVVVTLDSVIALDTFNVYVI